MILQNFSLIKWEHSVKGGTTIFMEILDGVGDFEELSYSRSNTHPVNQIRVTISITIGTPQSDHLYPVVADLPI